MREKSLVSRELFQTLRAWLFTQQSAAVCGSSNKSFSCGKLAKTPSNRESVQISSDTCSHHLDLVKVSHESLYTLYDADDLLEPIISSPVGDCDR